MTTSVTGITADLKLETAAFIRDLSRASAAVASNTSKMQRSMQTVERGFANAAGFVKGFISAAVSVQGLRSLAALGRQAIDTGDEIQESASKLGIGAEALQRLRFAAAQTDVDVTALNVAMKQFQKNLATGVIKATTGDISAAFEEWINKIREAPTQLEKVEIAVKAFSKQYQSALLIAAQGEIFTESMKSAFVISEQATQIASDLDNKIRALQNAAQVGFQTGFLEAFVGHLDDSSSKLTDINSAMMQLGGIVGGIVVKSANFIDKIAKFLADHPILTSFALDPTLGFGGGKKGAPLPGLSFEGMTEGLRGNTEAFVANTKAVSDWDTKVTDALGRSLEFEDLQREGTALFANMQTPLEEHASSLERLSVLYKSGAIDAQTFARANQQLTLGMAQNWLGAAGAVSGALTSMFKENKAIAVANAVINTAEAITSALKNPPGPPFSFVYAAAAAVSGAAQIATILSAQPGQGKTPSVKGGGKKVSGVSAAGSASTSSGSRPQQQSINLTVQGDFFTPEHFKRVLEGLNGVIADGARLNVSMR